MTSTCNWLTLSTAPVADNISSGVGHGESWPKNPWLTVEKIQVTMSIRAPNKERDSIERVRVSEECQCAENRKMLRARVNP